VPGGGLVATQDETIVEPLLGLPVEHPPAGGWLAADALDPAGHPVEAAGIRTDTDLRPVGPGDAAPLLANVRIVGGLLAGQRALRERCGDGVAVASGWRAAGLIAAELALADEGGATPSEAAAGVAP
jgi:glycerol-3-phosphate dehydrogenase subunit B